MLLEKADTHIVCVCMCVCEREYEFGFIGEGKNNILTLPVPPHHQSICLSSKRHFLGQ